MVVRFRFITTSRQNNDDLDVLQAARTGDLILYSWAWRVCTCASLFTSV